jgi:hypothetical protein
MPRNALQRTSIGAPRKLPSRSAPGVLIDGRGIIDSRGLVRRIREREGSPEELAPGAGAKGGIRRPVGEKAGQARDESTLARLAG